MSNPQEDNDTESLLKQDRVLLPSSSSSSSLLLNQDSTITPGSQQASAATMASTSDTTATATATAIASSRPPVPPVTNMFRSRKTPERATSPRQKRRRRKTSHHPHRHRHGSKDSNNDSHKTCSGGGGGGGGGTILTATTITTTSTAATTRNNNHNNNNNNTTLGGLCLKFLHCIWRWLTRSPTVAANTIPVQPAAAFLPTPRTSRWMGFLARGVLWTTIVSLCVAVIWYSYELFNHGTDPHLVAWFSAGAFVLLGFPISMWAIISHLANYNQPHVQVYIVRILWMVPLYSVGSWLAMRFRNYAIYIETVRDLYESYVLYSFLQFLIQVLGGEESLVLMLKDKSPTRGVHMWGLQWCLKPWLMGQPHRKTVYERDPTHHHKTTPVAAAAAAAGANGAASITLPTVIGSDTSPLPSSNKIEGAGRARAVKRIMWKSPFFVRCKFGVLQYVLLKFVSTIFVMILEHLGLYREGDFSFRSGYLYICFIANASQCWALYCLVFFYYATHTELSPIRPVGKFLSVKALVFFTWWQSVTISYLLWLDWIPEYRIQRQDWTSEDVAKGLQDYLICVEMFIIAIVHSFVFPHSEYSPQAVEARSRALNLAPMTKWQKKRLGRSKYSSQYLLFGKAADDLSANTPSLGTDVETELVSLNSESDATGWSSNVQGGTGGVGGGFSSQFTDVVPQQQQQQLRNSAPNTYLRGGSGGLASLQDEKHQQHRYSDFDPLLNPGKETRNDSKNSNREKDALVDITEEEGDVSNEDEDDDDEEGDGDNESESSEAEGDDDEEDAISEGHLIHYDEEATTVTDDATASSSTLARRGFMHALLETAIPTDMVDSTVGIVKGEYNVERKTLLNHAAASDQYDLFSPNRRPFAKKKKHLSSTSSPGSPSAGGGSKQ